MSNANVAWFCIGAGFGILLALACTLTPFMRALRHFERLVDKLERRMAKAPVVQPEVIPEQPPTEAIPQLLPSERQADWSSFVPPDRGPVDPEYAAELRDAGA